MVVSQFVSHAAVRALAAAMMAELVDLGGEVTSYSEGMCAIPPLSSTPMGGRNVAMLTSQQQSFLQNVILQIQQQIGHCDGIKSKSIANELTDIGGGNSISMGGTSGFGSSGSGAASSVMPMMGSAASGVSGISGVGNGGSSALNQVGSVATSTASSAVQAGTSGAHSNNSNSHSSSNHGSSHSSSHTVTSHKPLFSLKANPESTSGKNTGEHPISTRVVKSA